MMYQHQHQHHHNQNYQQQQHHYHHANMDDQHQHHHYPSNVLSPTHPQPHPLMVTSLPLSPPPFHPMDKISNKEMMLSRQQQQQQQQQQEQQDHAHRLHDLVTMDPSSSLPYYVPATYTMGQPLPPLPALHDPLLPPPSSSSSPCSPSGSLEMTWPITNSSSSASLSSPTTPSTPHISSLSSPTSPPSPIQQSPCASYSSCEDLSHFSDPMADLHTFFSPSSSPPPPSVRHPPSSYMPHQLYHRHQYPHHQSSYPMTYSSPSMTMQHPAATMTSSSCSSSVSSSSLLTDTLGPLMIPPSTKTLTPGTSYNGTTAATAATSTIATFDKLSKQPQSSNLPVGRPYSCANCPRAFTRKHDLQRHIRVHTGAKPYVCLSCKKAFARTDALKRHLRMEDNCRLSPEIQALKGAGKRRYRNL